MEGDRLIFEFCKKFLQISIHTLRMEGDEGDGVQVIFYDISIHTLRMEGDGGTEDVYNR